MILEIYKVNKNLPLQFIYEVLHCNRIWDLPPGVYKKTDTIEVDCTTVDEIIDLIENKDIILEESDIVEMLPDEYMLNNDLGQKQDYNYLIFTPLGVKRVAIDKENVFRNISLDALKELFT